MKTFLKLKNYFKPTLPVLPKINNSFEDIQKIDQSNFIDQPYLLQDLEENKIDAKQFLPKSNPTKISAEKIKKCNENNNQI